MVKQFWKRVIMQIPQTFDHYAETKAHSSPLKNQADTNRFGQTSYTRDVILTYIKHLTEMIPTGSNCFGLHSLDACYCKIDHS